jgi:hypothetical protein
MMGTEDTIVQNIENLLADHGMTVAQVINHLGRKNSTVLNLSEEKQKEFCSIYDQIDRDLLNKREKGRKLEQLVAILFGEESLFDCRQNYRTSTNEIDLLLSWSKKAREAGVANAFPCFGESFICECKNYESKMKVTYVGKFYSLLAVTKMKFGLIVAWEGITGRSEWADSKGLIKKIALKDDIFIVSLDKHDLKQIYNQSKNVYSILMDKFDALKSDISYEKFVFPHEAEEILGA